MATHLQDNISTKDLADTCDGIAAGLESDAEATHLSPTWGEFTKRADKLYGEQQGFERRLRRARIGALICDARWDSEVAAFGRAVVDASGGKRDKNPYLRFFNEYAPSAAQDQPYEKEVALANNWILELQRDPADPLAVWIPRIQAVTGALALAVQKKSSVEAEQSPIDTTKLGLVLEINLALDSLEGELLRIFPGQLKRISTFLSPTRPNRYTRSKRNPKKT